jgi:2-keto-4-pentenoate hydratase
MYTPTGPREAQLLEAVNTLLDARRTQTPVDDLPAELQPTSLEEVYWVQDELARSYGQVGGWKVGAPTPDATPLFAPMPQGWMGPSGTLLSTMKHRFRGLEAEIAFLLGHDLPPRETPYSDDEVYAAVAGAHPAIEVIESGLADPLSAARNSMLADLQMHGAFIFGANQPDWRKIDFTQERVTLTVDGSVRVERTGSNTAGNLLRLLPWLANEGAARTGGLRAGQWVTTGSWTGVTLATSGSTAEVRFDSMGKVALRFQ